GYGDKLAVYFNQAPIFSVAGGATRLTGHDLAPRAGGSRGQLYLDVVLPPVRFLPRSMQNRPQNVHVDRYREAVCLAHGEVLNVLRPRRRRVIGPHRRDALEAVP